MEFYFIKGLLFLNVFIFLYQINKISDKYPKGYKLVSKDYIKGIFEFGYVQGRTNGAKTIMEIVEGRGKDCIEFSKRISDTDMEKFEELMRKKFKED